MDNRSFLRLAHGTLLGLMHNKARQPSFENEPEGDVDNKKIPAEKDRDFDAVSWRFCGFFCSSLLALLP